MEISCKTISILVSEAHFTMYSTTQINNKTFTNTNPHKISTNSCQTPQNVRLVKWTMSSSITTKTQKKIAISPLLLLSSLVSTCQKHLNSLHNIIDPPLHPSVDQELVFTGNFTPVEEHEPTKCPIVEGKIPISLNGVYIRNGPNPQHKSNGPLHLFEGDGMLHSLKLSRGQATYCSRYVKTYKYMVEQEIGFPIFPNFLSGFHGIGDIFGFVVTTLRVLFGRINVMNGFGIANTSLAFFASKILALCETDLPYAIDVTKEGDIHTIGRWEFERKLFANMTAHPKIDSDTKEVFAFRCSVFFPYITYFSFDKNGVKRNEVPLSSIKKPTFIHDFAITKRFAVFVDTQLVIEPMQMVLGRGMPVICEESKVPRIGVIPRYATNDSEMKWFNVPGFNTVHVINAWENGEEEIVLIAPKVSSMENLLQRVDKVRFTLQKLTINIRTGEVSRKTLSRRNLELGCVNNSYIGKKHRYAYVGIVEKVPRMSGVVKIDLENECEVSRRFYGEDCYGGEPLFVARDSDDGASDEDDGFVVSYVHNESSGESSFVVMDAKSPPLDVVATVRLPRRIPYGFHGLFVSEDNL